MAQGADVRHTMATAVCGAVLAVSASAAAQGIRTVTETAEPIPIVTQVRHTTTVVLPATETIVDVVAGDGEYWDVSASANVAYVKPLDAAAASNVTLVAESGRVWALVVSETAHRSSPRWPQMTNDFLKKSKIKGTSASPVVSAHPYM